MTPYYLLQIETFDESINEFSTPSQINIEGTIDREPEIQIKKHPQQIIDGFLKYDLICEIPQKQKGRAYGTEDIFESFIRIEEKRFIIVFALKFLLYQQIEMSLTSLPRSLQKPTLLGHLTSANLKLTSLI